MDYYVSSRSFDVAPPRAAPADRTAVRGLLVMLGACIFLQRFALPLGGELQVSLPFIVGYIVLGFLVLLGRLTVSATLAMTMFVAMSSITLALLISSDRASLTSYALLWSIYLLYIFKIKNRDGVLAGVWNGYLNMMAVAALAGIGQFVGQFVLPMELVFPLDSFVPGAFLYDGYNTVTPLDYGVDIYRSNGVFFLEPSFYSQFLGLALVIEMLGSRRLLRLCLYAAALLVSYSGTGIAIAALFLPWLLLRRGSIGLLAACFLGAGLLVAIGGALNLELLTDRVYEFSAPESSGFARFISPFLMVRDFMVDSMSNMLFGMGPGAIDNIMRQSASHGYLAHDPTWVKLLFEYGLIAAMCLLFYVFMAIGYGSPYPTLSVALCFLFLVLGGYLLNGFVHVLIVALGAWHNELSARTRAKHKELAFVWK